MSLVSELVGGLALFLYGMGVMSDGLKSTAGQRLESILLKATKSRLVAFLLGLGTTSLVQSSSAVTVMLIGIVDSGILQYARTFFVIMGSNVGTTVTAWLIGLNGIGGLFSFLKPIIFAPILALFGVMLFMSKRDKNHHVGAVIVGFAILIIGIDMMSEAVAFLENTSAFEKMLSIFSNPLTAVLFSLIFTAIIQSSSATVGIIQALAFTGNISFTVGASLVLGANVGTCITGLIASVGRSKSAKRVAVLQSYFNLFGALVFLLAVVVFKKLMPGLSRMPAGALDIALIHTLFNLLTTVILLPFNKQIIRITEKTVK